MARQFKATYTGLFPPLKGFIPTVGGDGKTTVVEDIGQYTDGSNRIVAPAAPGIVLARNQYTGASKTVTITYTDGVTTVNKPMKLDIKPPVGKGMWQIKDNVPTKAGMGVELTCLGGMPSEAFDVYFIPLTPDKHNRIYYEQITSYCWHISPNLGGGSAYMVEMGKYPVPNLAQYSIVMKGCDPRKHPPGYCYASVFYWATILVKLRAINLATDETLGDFCLSIFAYTYGKPSIAGVTWNYDWAPAPGDRIG
jgi:hypothetical protein